MIRKHTALPFRLLPVLLVALSLLGWSCEEKESTETIEPGSTVLALLNQQENLSLFADALSQTGVTTVLQNQNLNVTLFAPTNDAFSAYLQAKGYASISDAPADELNSLANYHLSYGRITASRLDSALLIDTFDDRRIFVFTSTSTPTISLNNQAQVVESDLQANNGIIHTLNQVLVPPTQSLGGYLAERTTEETPEFTILYAALQRAELLEFLSNNQHAFTLFAPTDAAFAAAGYATTADIDNADPAVLRNLLQYHLLTKYRFTNMFATGNVKSQLGKNVSLDAGAKTVKGAGNEQAANLLPNEQDRLTTNGVLHAIDAVLLPGQ